MPKEFYLPNRDADRIIWLNNFAAKLPNYISQFALEPSDSGEMQAAATWYSTLLNYREQVKAYSEALTQLKNSVSNSTSPAPAFPEAPVETPALTNPIEPGIFPMAQTLVARIKAHAAYNLAVGEDLQIEGADQDMPDNELQKPIITIRSGTGGLPEVVWTKGQMTGIEIQTQNEAGDWTLLAIDTVPNYVDTRPVASGTADIRKYRAIYLMQDERFGQWSDEVSFTVG